MLQKKSFLLAWNGYDQSSNGTDLYDGFVFGC